ncbi:DUF6916 family protein [Undibacterium flavidum]|uniref:DUF6916 domain-containing protein n=1 Tax=Undibacterium flavidum TaxID=2762297 RepID=A0ABR6YBW1_9BURK|nr:hypothetical protein [Undibacterium flavidum]MBC3873669.1 hypothetical protein [Undibacterium flavidum]
MKLPRYNMFLECINSAFKVRSNTGADTSLVLKTVSALEVVAPESASQNQQAFSLIFEGDMQNFLPQGTYQFLHAQLGETAIFIVPIGPERDRNQMRYEAIFN